MNPIVLPTDLSALYALLANPVTAGIVLSMIIEQLPFIEDESVKNWIKALFCVLIGVVWSFFVTVAGPQGLPTSATGWYTLIATGLAVVFSMNIWHTVVIQGMPALRDLLIALFGKQASATFTSLVSGEPLKAYTTNIKQSVTGVGADISINEAVGQG